MWGLRRATASAHALWVLDGLLEDGQGALLLLGFEGSLSSKSGPEPTEPGKLLAEDGRQSQKPADVNGAYGGKPMEAQNRGTPRCEDDRPWGKGHPRKE
ncbi:hypothetical protein MPNT_40058 [Candidatus Methylacidithermus pantelleriae]|uniref:Uncharacterized protein n=1 Tax=Candidatus Methylacidithermus pantelleriae TaxID=2744239 RepID=A0A8J2BJT9_9BACT|nr:hypothetical protein MPNT_40058 [Candidatus Methylacidithermus pantelleriae]